MHSENLMNQCKQRRQAVLDQMPDHSIALLFANTHAVRTHDLNYPFRQSSHFYYLTGVVEADAILLLVKDTAQSILFSHEKDLSIEQWEGLRIGTEKAISDYAMDQAFTLSDLETQLLKHMKNIQSIWIPFQALMTHSKSVLTWIQKIQAQVRQGINAPTALQDLNQILCEMRLKKSDYEIEQIRMACDISVEAHHAAMQAVKSKSYEYELEAILQQHFIQHGARFPAYESIVAAGDNGCILHYVSNQDPLREGDLVLIDAGCEKNYYNADITRTFPVNGKFSEKQKEIYEVVLRAQQTIISQIRPGLTWNTLQETAVRVLTESLIELGILKGSLEENIENKCYRSFYMHGSGHWLGMDVHDVGNYSIEGTSRVLEPGMVFTVEPGLYFSQYCAETPEAYRSIGVRIEDDILVTENGFENLTAALPSDIETVEQIING